MYLKCRKRFKDGKEHRYWSIAEKRRTRSGFSEWHVLYLGEINDSQHASWMRCIEAFDETTHEQKCLALFPSDRAIPEHAGAMGVQVRLAEFSLHRPRQWGACWVFMRLWEELGMDDFWRERLPASRKDTSWHHVLMLLVAHRLIAPGSEWKLHREWFDQSAMADLLGEDNSIAAKDTLYRCLDKLLEHKQELLPFLTDRWQQLFGITYDILLYDLTSTYFESSPPFPEGDKRRFGYSRDHRSDCVQVIIALVVTPEGLPLDYEVMPGNTHDSATLPHFLDSIEHKYGKARRVWVMDRGIPSEEHLDLMRNRGISYLVGTPKGRLSKLEQRLAQCEWHDARDNVRVKLLAEDKELYVFVKSEARIGKERAMRRRKLKKLWNRLHELQKRKPSYEALLFKLGAAKKDAGRVWPLVDLALPDAPAHSQKSSRVDFKFSLNKDKLRIAMRREGRYLLRTNLTETSPARLWEFYLQLTEVEAAFKNLKGDLSVRPIYHQVEGRIEAHIFVAFLAYCLHATLRQKLRRYASGLTVRQLLDKFSGMQMLDAHFPTTDGRTLIFTRHTEPEKDHKMLLAQLGWELPVQSPPRLSQEK